MNDLPNWHGITWAHTTFTAIALWVTHANWQRIGAGFRAVQSFCEARVGGFVPGVFNAIFGKPISGPQPATGAAETKKETST